GQRQQRVSKRRRRGGNGPALLPRHRVVGAAESRSTARDCPTTRYAVPHVIRHRHAPIISTALDVGITPLREDAPPRWRGDPASPKLCSASPLTAPPQRRAARMRRGKSATSRTRSGTPSRADPVLELSPDTLSPQRAAQPSQHLPRESPRDPIPVLVERLARHVDLEHRAQSGLAHANRNGRPRGPTLP